MKNFIFFSLLLIIAACSADPERRLAGCDCNDTVTNFTVIGSDQVGSHVEPTPDENCFDGTAIDTTYFTQGGVDMFQTRETICP